MSKEIFDRQREVHRLRDLYLNGTPYAERDQNELDWLNSEVVKIDDLARRARLAASEAIANETAEQRAAATRKFLAEAEAGEYRRKQEIEFNLGTARANVQKLLGE